MYSIDRILAISFKESLSFNPSSIRVYPRQPRRFAAMWINDEGAVAEYDLEHLDGIVEDAIRRGFCSANMLEKKYTVLELDTFRFSTNGNTNTAYCVIEIIPINEMASTSELSTQHHNLMENYKKQDWNFCEQAIEHLTGKWGGELDSFYTELSNRISKLKTSNLPSNWSPIIEKN